MKLIDGLEGPPTSVALKGKAELTTPSQRIVDNILTIGRLTAQLGEAPGNAPSSLVRVLSVNCGNYELQTVSNLDARIKAFEKLGELKGTDVWTTTIDLPNPHLEIVRMGEPKPEVYKAAASTDIQLIVNPDLKISLIVDLDRFPEAEGFEEPIADASNPIAQPETNRTIVNKTIHLNGPLDSLGPKTLGFIEKFTTEVLREYKVTPPNNIVNC